MTPPSKPSAEAMEVAFLLRTFVCSEINLDKYMPTSTVMDKIQEEIATALDEFAERKEKELFHPKEVENIVKREIAAERNRCAEIANGMNGSDIQRDFAHQIAAKIREGAE